MIITSINETKHDLERLVNALRFREIPIIPDDGKKIRELYSYFVGSGCKTTENCILIQFPRDDPFSIYNLEDMFTSPTGRLEPALQTRIDEIYDSLDIPVCYSYYNGIPLKLCAPTAEKLGELMNTIPVHFRRFCSFMLETIGPVMVD